MIPNVLAVIGASSVFGKVDPEKGGFVGRLKTWHESVNPEENSLFNLGVPGDTTSEMLERAPLELRMRKPGLAIFSLGSNDTARDGRKNGPPTTELKTFIQNVQKLILTAKKISKKVIFVSAYPINDSKTQPFKNSNKYYNMRDLIHYVNGTKELCEKMDIPYLNVFDLFLKEDYKKYVYIDGLHCNEEGHKRIFEELKKFLSDLY